MTTVAIPATIAEVTAEWITIVLHEAGALPHDVPVTAIEVTRIGEGIGIMGDLYRVALDHPLATPASVVVKLPSAAEANRAQGVTLGMYDAEVRFYRDLAATTRARTPECHLAVIVPGTADSVLVLEDVSHLRMVNQADGMTADEAMLAVRALAEVHGSWWGRVQTPDMEWIPSMVADRIQGFAALYPQLVEPFLAKFADRLPPGGAELVTRVAEAYWPVMQRLASRPWTLVHQDFRVENLFFGRTPDDDQLVILDWQTLGRGAATYDLSYLLGGSMDIELRRATERELVAAYHARLVALGVDIGPDEVWDDYRLAHLAGGPAVSVLTGATFDLANERGVELVATMASRHLTACLDLDALELLG